MAFKEKEHKSKDKYMKNKLLYILIALVGCCLWSCNDDDTFSTSRGNLLTMGADTVSFDTVFSRIPTAARDFWIKNESGDGIRCKVARLERGNQSGFRVNVDGVYLGAQTGYKASDIEIRKGDSIRVFVELTAPANYEDGLKMRSDNLVFTLESGIEQRVHLNAWTWDADTVHTLVINRDTTISTHLRPLIVFNDIIVNEGAHLTIAEGSTLYFHDFAGIKVHGRLHCQGDSTANVTLRGYRLDRMFDYLPYDDTPGHWQGIHFYPESTGNVIDYTDLHSPFNGIVCDSTGIESRKLTISNSIIHNCQGYGIMAKSSDIDIQNTQISNTMYPCLDICGGSVNVLHCTIAQFYPFTGGRGIALRVANTDMQTNYPLYAFNVTNSIVTGYAYDVITASIANERDSIDFNYFFAHNVLRTPEDRDTLHFVNNLWDLPDSLVNGELHFVKVDMDNQQYDFHLDSLSTARGVADPLRLLPTNREGLARDPEHPTAGCY